MVYDIIPDIHGQFWKLSALLSKLGYREFASGWRHPDQSRMVVFLGDFIDRGPQNAEVLQLVRRMLDNGSARAIMGNHELNALHYHTLHPETGKPLRARSPKNQKQHIAFLREFAPSELHTVDALAWMASLPLYLDLKEFRVVHACWNDRAIEQLRSSTENGVLSGDQIVNAADNSNSLSAAIDLATKGPEARLPQNHSFRDKEGHERFDIRVKWWNREARDWRGLAMSVPNPDELPDISLPPQMIAETYAQDANPVFFGHYWMSGDISQQAPNALCLDYSAGTDGPLISYRFEEGDRNIFLSRITDHL
ncbi:metallophosphoesterase [Phaeovulum sp.]|uniref:metallophosphoesterase n=1 Tax=Phaeovulum sp. TaxID=2934796 RepID=UPI003562DC88